MIARLLSIAIVLGVVAAILAAVLVERDSDPLAPNQDSGLVEAFTDLVD